MPVNRDFRSNWFRMSGWQFIKTIMMLHGKVWIACSFALVALSATLGIWIDLRFFILALMILLLIFPLEVAFIYFYYGLHPDLSFNAANHRVLLNGNNLNVEMKFIWKDGAYGFEEIRYKVKTIPLSRLGKFVVIPGSVCINYGRGTKGFIWLPGYAFENEDSLKLFIEKIYNNVS